MIQVGPCSWIFPLLGCVAVLLMLARVVALCCPGSAASLPGGGIAFYLALRRLAGARAISVGLIVCVALPGALLTYTSTITQSVQDEIVAKYRTNVGAPRVLSTVGIGQTDPDLHGVATNVVIYRSSPRIDGDTQVYVLGVDPASFGRFALLDADQRSCSTNCIRYRPGSRRRCWS